jgi:hypothetical protein
MKKIGILALTAVVGAAQAQTFTNSVWSSSLSNVGAQVATQGTCIQLDLRNFVLNANNASGGLSWNFDFTSGANAYSSVDFTIYGSVTVASPQWNTKLDIFASEQVFDTSAAATMVGSGWIVTSKLATAGQNSPVTQNFTATVNIPFSALTSKGSVSKDMFFSLSGFGTNGGNAIIGSAEISRIEQCFNPVPEPATMASLAIGTALLARRRRKS